MTNIQPYLNFPGTTEEAFNFYKSVFGGEFLIIQRFKESPVSAQVPAEDQDKIMHIALPVGNGGILMASDALESLGQQVTVGNNQHLSLNAESESEAEQLFNGLAEGGTITMPLEKTFWGAYFGMLTDRYGIPWMVNYDMN